MRLIIDSEAHPWVRLPADWRHPTTPDAPRVGIMSERGRAVWMPSRDANALPEETLGELLEAMDANGVGKSLVMSAPFVCPNEEVARVAAQAPDRLIGFAKYGRTIPPFTTAAERRAALDEVEVGLRDLRLRGVGEVSCAQWWPEPPEAAVAWFYSLMELCRSYRVPLCIHAHAGRGAQDDGRGPGAAYGDPALFRPLAADFPDVPLVLFHMGGRDRAHFEAALAVARAHASVHFNTAQTRPEFLTEAVRALGAERIFFGVDWYALEPKETIEGGQHQIQMRIVAQAEMSERERQLVMGESLAALLGIS
jgi:predicted TIM-barrel fold metal-dependent hydrolase